MIFSILADCLPSFLRDGGLKGLFTGFGPRVGRAGPSVGIVVSFYEVVKFALNHRQTTSWPGEYCGYFCLLPKRLCCWEPLDTALLVFWWKGSYSSPFLIMNQRSWIGKKKITSIGQPPNLGFWAFLGFLPLTKRGQFCYNWDSSQEQILNKILVIWKTSALHLAMYTHREC